MGVRVSMICDIATPECLADADLSAGCDGSQMGVVRAYQQLMNLAYANGWNRVGHQIACAGCYRATFDPGPKIAVKIDASPVAEAASGKINGFGTQGNAHKPPGHPEPVSGRRGKAV
jgi:hypothetical protein